jgi:hypothetical protein
VPTPPPPPDRFQREIDDIIRLAERRLEHQSFGHRMRRSTRRLGGALSGFSLKLPAPEMLAGWGLALLLVSWLLSLLRFIPMAGPLQFWLQALGVLLLAAGLITSLMRGRGAGGPSSGGGGDKMWRGERVYYGSPYGGPDGFLGRIRRILRGRR